MKRNSTILSLHTRYQSRRLTLLIILLASYIIPLAHSRTVQYTRVSTITQILAVVFAEQRQSEGFVRPRRNGDGEWCCPLLRFVVEHWDCAVVGLDAD
jgi:hypothetical protein